MQRVLVVLALMGALLLAGCLGPIQDRSGGEDRVLFEDKLNERDPVVIEETETGRIYRFDLALLESSGGSLARFTILPVSPINVSATWMVAFDAFAEQDECSVLSMSTGSIGGVDAALPSAGSMQWTDGKRIRGEAMAGVGVSTGLDHPEESPRLSTDGDSSWALSLDQELSVVFGSSRPGETFALTQDPRQHELELVVEVEGDSVILGGYVPISGPDGQGFLECGHGADSIRFTAARVGVGPVNAVVEAGRGYSEAGRSLVWLQENQVEGGEVRVWFHDEVFDNPQQVARSSTEPGPVGVAFEQWVEVDDMKPYWAFTTEPMPWLEHALWEDRVFSGQNGAGVVAS